MLAANVVSWFWSFCGPLTPQVRSFFEIGRKDGVQRPLETAGYASPEMVEVQGNAVI